MSLCIASYPDEALMASCTLEARETDSFTELWWGQGLQMRSLVLQN